VKQSLPFVSLPTQPDPHFGPLARAQEASANLTDATAPFVALWN